MWVSESLKNVWVYALQGRKVKPTNGGMVSEMSLNCNYVITDLVQLLYPKLERRKKIYLP